ncbi:RluA family pseudouridine synthase [Alicyclobacillus acidoterrestris]|uniref:Pseudouridine synthase n=1 Tax=Alicyclobacillus acidoterrestris (strain ATCC 49025 / DSM 3922 / CIP 106132 / NCIMB 13137 / GD3B) TaxID=1356854 RepID=T0CZE5_ALIAG|nr:RluA family pseudouridine synthase [Alicyclobacillus acidoterrestris]EPZ44667.1 hypothetical protein N007_10545 [Alicyclobacillus acidoterrestris ATCC 49025]UNO50317.1 RluA family pseudouridine synthase [Alicyclobacillus acidoterrestris]
MQSEMRAGHLHIHLDKRFNGWRVLDVLTTAFALPEAFSRRLCAAGLVRLGKRTLQPDDTVQTGARLVLEDPSPVAATPNTAVEDPGFCLPAGVAPLEICYEDDHVLVVNKPAGVIVHSDDPLELTLDTLVAQYYWQSGQYLPVRHVHRLDKPTTGAVVYAKHGFVARALDAQLTTHQMSRRYLAVVYGDALSKTQTVAKPIGRDRHRAGAYRVSSTGKPARTHIVVQAASVIDGQQLSLLSCRLETGRTHQIRVHCAALGAPILGDMLYGGRANIHAWPPQQAIALHAREVAFFHPYDEQEVVIKCRPGNDWMAFLRKEWGVEDDV